MNKRNDIYKYIKFTAKRIGEKFHPRKIILFGSYAGGKPNHNSDIDLLVIFSKIGNRRKRYVEVSRELNDRPVPIDLLIRTSEDIKKRLKIGDSFIEDIIGEGKVLFES